MDGEEATAPEDLSKWTVDDVCSFVGGLAGCGEYAPVRAGEAAHLLSPHSPRPSHPKAPLLKNHVWGGEWVRLHGLPTPHPPPHRCFCLQHSKLYQQLLSGEP